MATLFFPKTKPLEGKSTNNKKKGGHTFSVRSFDSGRTLFLLLCWRKRAFNREDLENEDFEPFKTFIHIKSVKNSRSLTTFNFLLAACSHLFLERALQNQIHSHYLLLIIPIINYDNKGGTYRRLVMTIVDLYSAKEFQEKTFSSSSTKTGSKQPAEANLSYLILRNILTE